MTNVNQSEKYDLEQQFILRLPLAEAVKIRNILETKPDKIKKNLKIDLNLTDNRGTIKVCKKKLYGVLKKFPTIIESYKTYDKFHIFKTADINQMFVCDYDKKENEKFELIHGLTPPLKNVKTKRFRKTLINPDQAMEVESIERELYYLLRTDFEAVSSRYEIIYEKIDEDKESWKKEFHLFGNISSEMSDDSN